MVGEHPRDGNGKEEYRNTTEKLLVSGKACPVKFWMGLVVQENTETV